MLSLHLPMPIRIGSLALVLAGAVSGTSPARADVRVQIGGPRFGVDAHSGRYGHRYYSPYHGHYGYRHWSSHSPYFYGHRYYDRHWDHDRHWDGYHRHYHRPYYDSWDRPYYGRHCW